MNDTTEIGTAPDTGDVRAYVTAVRAWLGDLPADEVEDLTAGMEADLAERAAESGERLGPLLGEPEAYAAELRSAAGLPPRSVPVSSPDAGLTEPWTDRLEREARELVERHPVLRELRPTWWLARGAVLGWVLASVLGTGRTLLLPMMGAGLSLWLGLALRRRDPLPTAGRLGLAAANVLAVVLLLPMLLFYAPRGAGYPDEAAFQPAPSAQVVANGEPAQNLYAYDAAGNRLDGVRVFDQQGRPLYVALDPLMDGSTPDLPTRPDTGAPDVAADVFPLSWPGHDAWQDPGFGWTPPLTLTPLAAAGATPSPTPSPSTSPSAGPSPSPSPSVSPSTTP